MIPPNQIRPILLVGLLLLGNPITFTHTAHAANAGSNQRTKLRILVDKVLQKHNDWVAEPWMIDAAANAGFNVYSPRRGGDDLDAVGDVTRWCEEAGIRHLVWMRGTREAPSNTPEADRLVWADGTVSRLWSPNSEQLWSWMRKRIIAYSRIASDHPALMGVFLDFENYQPTGKPNTYPLSYDLGILKHFAAQQQIALPDLEPNERKPWLEKNALHDAFESFQVAHWQERCQDLRNAVDQHAPAFRFCIYPAPGTKFVREAAYPTWATETAPLILADARTYGRDPFLPLREALAENRRKLNERIKVPTQSGIPFNYLGGIDPVVRGADPEFSGKNAVMISEATGGYWIFYEGPTYTADDHARYWKWFTWANHAIAKHRWAVQHEPRETAREWNLSLWKTIGELPPLRFPKSSAKPIDLPPIRLRRDNLLLIGARPGQKVKLTLKHVPIADYRSLLGWELRDPDRRLLKIGTIDFDDKDTLTFTADRGGVYQLGVSAGQCAYRIVTANAPVGIHAGAKCSLIGGAERLYFHVPSGLEQFKVHAEGRGNETVRLTVFDALGEPAGSKDTTPDKSAITLSVASNTHDGATWSLSLTEAATGILEDARVKLGNGLPPVVSFAPGQVFLESP